VWNRDKRFTGWTDVDLTDTGVRGAHEVGQLLKKEGLSFDVAYTSVLKRAIHTLWIVQDELDLAWIPVTKSWKLNERHYGALQGENKVSMAEQVGAEQVQVWRRSFDVAPPALEEADARHPLHAAQYREVPKDLLPATESLKDTITRVIPYWNDEIVASAQQGNNVLVSAHGNSIRAIIKHLLDIPDDVITGVEIHFEVPLVFTVDTDGSLTDWYMLMPDGSHNKDIQSLKDNYGIVG
jgi:2,3-bisphosphoglycerate-dependent phosphoglycerate mutase